MRKAPRSAHRFSDRRLKTPLLLASIAAASLIAGSAYAGGGGPALTTTAQQVYVDDFTTTGALSTSYAVDGSGGIDTTTQFQGVTGTPVPNALWLGGTNPILTAAGKYSVTEDTQIPTTLAANFTIGTSGSPTNANYFGGNLYVTSTTANYYELSEVSGSTVTHLPGFPTAFVNGASSASDFVMADADASNPYGFDTIYVANTTLGLQKWTYNGTAYANVWTIGSNATTMGFAPDPTNTFVKSLVLTTDGQGDNVLYGIAVDGTVKGSGTATYDDTYLVKLTDPDGSTTVGTDNFTELAASTPLEEFGGVAFAPSGTGFGTGDLAVLQVGSSAVPEPASLGLIGLAVASLMGRRRKLQG